MRSLLQSCPCRRRSEAVSSSAAPGPGAPPSTADKAAAADAHRQRGNEHFKRKEFARAAAAYGDAINLQPAEASFWLNRSIAYRQLEEWDQAESDAAKALQLQPGNEKATYGRALALQHLGKVTEAVAACKAGLAEHPENKALQELERALLAPPAPAKAETAQPKKSTQPAKAAGPKKYDIDYSKWKDLEDSDDDRGAGHDEYRPKKGEAEWKGENPSEMQRLQMVEDMLEACYKVVEKEGITMTEPPKAVSLPRDHMKPVGILTLEQLSKYSCSNDRMLVSLYGDIHDVSIRPDVYGYGPKSFQAGKDITWSVIIGEETPKQCNRFYDIFKLDEDHLKRYLQIVCQRLVALREEFGDPVGRLETYVHERSLPPPPKGEIEECKQQ